MNHDKPELAWNLADYLDRQQEPPGRILKQPQSCEGELMSDDEIVTYIRDAIRTLIVLNDSGSSAFDLVQQAFMADLKFLTEIGRISPDEYNEIINEDNFRL